MFKNLSSLVTKNLTSLFYSFAITLGIYIALQELHQYNNSSSFMFFSFAIFMIYIIELYTFYQSKSHKVELNLDIKDEVNEVSHIFHKLILPIALYISIIGFGYYNFSSSFLIVILAITFVIFFVLFVNTKAFLQNRLNEEYKTHYIYDIIKFLIFFLIIDTLSNAYRSTGVYLSAYTLIAAFSTFVIIALMIWRIEKIRKKTLFYSGIASIFTGILFYSLHRLFNLSPLQLSLSLIFLFYISTALIHHKIMATLSKSVILEYILVIGMVLAIMYGVV